MDMQLLEKLVKITLSMADISAMTGVQQSTLYNWRKAKPELFAVVYRGCLERKFDGHRR
jgi:negative regulator of genetic competence, sporulation and motility